MKKNFIKSTIILLVGGFITKVLGMVIKIIMAREISTEGLGLYMLVLPTFMLLINLSQFGFPLSLAKLISEERRNTKNLFFSILPILIIINLIIGTLLIVFAPYISTNLLHNKDTHYSIISIAFVLPFTTISSIARSYFFGHEKMIPHIVSNITEDIVRLIVIKVGIKHFLPFGLKYIVSFLILANVLSEIAATCVLIIFLPKKIKIQKTDLIPNKTYIRESLKISIPTTSSRLIGSIGLFLEPIILTKVLLQAGYKAQIIAKEYGIITGYVLPLILLPSFFTLAISQALLPTLTKEYKNKNIKNTTKIIIIAVILSLLIGIPTTMLLEINPHFLLQKIYHTTKGTSYIRVLAPFCLLQYIQSPLASSFDALGKSKDNLTAVIIGTIVRILTLYLSSFLKIGIWSLIISLCLNIITTTTYQIIKINLYLKKQKKIKYFI